MTDPKVKALVVSRCSSVPIPLFVRTGESRYTTRQPHNYTCYKPDDSDTLQSQLSTDKSSNI